MGRRCILACAFFLIPYPQNIGARFLIPALPYAALGIALALEFSRTLQTAVAAAALFLAWPRVIDRYRAPAGGWQIVTVPWKAALHIVPPESYLTQHCPGYRLAQDINRHVPAKARLWSSIPIAEAYTTPDVLVFYYSAEGELIRDMLLTPVTEETQPRWNIRFTFPARTVTHLRLAQGAASSTDMWSVGEARFFRNNREVNPVHATASAFPWDIRLALDRNPVTRWRSWESMHPGMHVDFDFGAPTELDRVEVHCSPDQWKVDIRMEGFAAKRERIDETPAGDLRALATRTIHARGVDYLVIDEGFPAAADIRANAQGWGLKLVAERESNRLYKIQ